MYRFPRVALEAILAKAKEDQISIPEAIIASAKENQISRAMSILPPPMWETTIEAIRRATSVQEIEEVMVQAIIQLHPRPINR
jgi:threonine synthase